MRVLLTGASGGIGSALARAFAEHGHALLLQGRDASRLRVLQSSITGVECDFIVGDLSDADERHRMAEAAGAFAVDTLCNNAGINHFGAFAGCDVARLIDVNVTATLALTQAVLPQLMSTEAPRVAIIGSAFGSIGFPGYTTYCASKFALRGFAESLAREYADTPLRVSYISPRATATSMNDDRVNALNEALGTATDAPEVVAREVLQCLERDRRRQQIGRTESLRGSLNAVVPAIVDRALRGKLPTIKKYFPENEHV
jgi:short-subunit dehydrogenase